MSADGHIYGKYRVERVDGNEGPGMKHDDCKLFVLDLSHDPFARPAALAYADACRATHPTLANDLEALARDEFA
jgi:hypothetical protein